MGAFSAVGINVQILWEEVCYNGIEFQEEVVLVRYQEVLMLTQKSIALIAHDNILIFFWDPLEPLSHDPDVKALLCIAVVWNIPVACNRASADFLSSLLMCGEYERRVPDYRTYRERLQVKE